jgi:hypothetical protein
LGVWGEKWLAKEREAEEQTKTLPVTKMKILFKSAVSSVPKFKRWLEGRVFVSSSDWFEVLTRKLHKSLGKTQEDEHDNRDRNGQYPPYDGGRGTWRGRGYEARGGGEARGGSASRGGGETSRGQSQPYRGTSSGHQSGFNRDSPRDAGFASHQFSHVPPARANHISGPREGDNSDFQDGTERAGADDWLPTTAQGDGEWEEGHWDEEYERSNQSEDRYGRFNAAGAHGHSGGAEPMNYSPLQARGRGGARGGRGGGEARSPRKPVNDPAEDTAEKLTKGVRWHNSAKADSQCRDPDCGTRQDVPYCQGCAMHGHDRMFCFKAREPMFNATGYWDINRPNQPPIQGLRGIRTGGHSAPGEAPKSATARGNMMDAGTY